MIEPGFPAGDAHFDASLLGKILVPAQFPGAAFELIKGAGVKSAKP